MKQLLIITLNWPTPDFSAAGVRLLQLTTFFQKEGYKITVASTAEKNVEVDAKAIRFVNILLNDESFDTFVEDLNPDVVMFDRFMSEEQFGWRISERAPNALKILDTEDLHSLRKSREAAFKKKLTWTVAYWQQYEITKREVASILRCDISLIISDFEMELLATIVPNHNTLLLHLPFMVNIAKSERLSKKPSFNNRKDFLFIGFGGHKPNLDAILYLKSEIWPLILKQMPTAKLNIYGSHFPEHIYQLQNKSEGFLIHGWAKNAHKVIENARLLLAPLRFGAGQKGKLLDAMLCGTPSITTSIGAEGMQGSNDWNGKIFDEAHSFAKAAIMTYSNENLWLKYQKNGLDIIQNNFDLDKHSTNLKEKLKHTIGTLKEHRRINFMGSLIQSHTLASIKYMAKWIEEKNKK